MRMYRELFYQNIAKQALNQAEFLFKSTASRGGQSDTQNTKLFVENKRLMTENKKVHKQLNELNMKLETE